jgi:hypothetical protein
VLEGWTIDLNAQKMTLPYCANITILIITCAKGPKTQVPVFIVVVVKLLPHCCQIVKVSRHKGVDLRLLDERDFLFKPV